MFQPNIGKEFKTQMESWFEEHPEISHEWNGNQLKISHPKELGNSITFRFDAKLIKVKNGKKSTIFKRKLFRNIQEQVVKIRGYWLNELLTEEDTGIIKPKLKENQIAAMFCNSKYGQVLTTKKNAFIGWGNVYQIFESKDDAQKFLNEESNNDKIEIYFYNSEYELIEIKKEN